MREPKKLASQELIAGLAALAEVLSRPTRVDFTKGRIVKRTTKTGWTRTFVFAPGLNSVGLFNVDVKMLRELSSILARIADGEDARALFRQHERKKPKKTGEHATRALAYWSIRALNPAAKDSRALRKARAIIANGESLSDETIRRMARAHRERSLSFLAISNVRYVEVDGGKTIKMRSPNQVAALRDYLRIKSPRLGE